VLHGTIARKQNEGYFSPLTSSTFDFKILTEPTAANNAENKY
jgi:hypothetical protein